MVFGASFKTKAHYLISSVSNVDGSHVKNNWGNMNSRLLWISCKAGPFPINPK